MFDPESRSVKRRFIKRGNLCFMEKEIAALIGCDKLGHFPNGETHVVYHDRDRQVFDPNRPCLNASWSTKYRCYGRAVLVRFDDGEIVDLTCDIHAVACTFYWRIGCTVDAGAFITEDHQLDDLKFG